ncbi:MAG TPA: LysM peptidoglycan-binding domain-containing protein [Salinimicrobium sp.]|nr:LysM peptidoglycan-binding domain-containing protein [Salinimicrobium sp.]
MKYIIVLLLFFNSVTAEALVQQFRYHIVEKGETIYSIAQKYNTSEEILFEYNPDARNGIDPNDKLVVPVTGVSKAESQVEFKTHKVRKRETLFSLSQRYNVSIDEIKRYNKHLYSNELRRGERIRIPLNTARDISPVFRENDRNPVSNPLNISVKEHVVLPKETKFGISQKYNITVAELERLNPGLEVLQPGMILKVSSKRIAEEKDEILFEYYLVKPDETIYSLTRKFGISKDSLIVLNPALAEGLRSGMVLKIPNLDPLIPKRSNTGENIVNLEDSISISRFGRNDLAVMLPFNAQKIVTTDTSSNVKEQLRADKVMQIALDFYSGVLMAVDSAKSIGISTNLRVYDTQQSSGKVNAIINTNDFEQVDAVIGPLLQAEAETAAAALQREGIPVISPLTKKETLYISNFYQTRPSEEMLVQAMLTYLRDNGSGKNIVIIADASSAGKKRTLLQIFPDAEIVNPRESSYVDQEELISSLEEGRKNWVILETDKINIISNATSYLNSLADKYEITLFTTQKNNSFESDNVSNHHLSRLNFHYPSVDREYIDGENSFIQKYKSKYGMVPNTYAIRGFDVTYDILLRLASYPTLEESILAGGTTEYVENKFDYEKKPSGGYYNRAIYIMAYGDKLELNTVKDDLESNLFRRFKD